jgi:ribosomal protein S18 acetylase RimI-like enzyme
MELRAYAESDMCRIEQINAFLALQIKYHGGVQRENIICAIENDMIVGAGILVLQQDIMEIEKIIVDLYTYSDENHQNDSSLTPMMTDGLIVRFIELQAADHAHAMYLRAFRMPDELLSIQLLLCRGFTINGVIPWMKCDLSNNCAQYSIPDEIRIERYEFDAASMQKYLEAAASSGLHTNGAADSWFRTGAPGFACFAALHNNEVVGAISIWDTSADCGATEFIFVVPSYRRRNIAKGLIATAFDELRKRGKKEASLTVHGLNLRAIKLYLSLNYHLVGNIMELGFTHAPQC